MLTGLRAYRRYLQIPASRKSSGEIRERVRPSLMYAQMPPRVTPTSGADVSARD